jgi:hypothetical protein
MGLFDRFKKKPSQDDLQWAAQQKKNMEWALNDEENRKALDELSKKVPLNILQLFAKIKSGAGLTGSEQQFLTNTMKSKPEIYREFWVRWTGNIELATDEEREKWFAPKASHSIKTLESSDKEKKNLDRIKEMTTRANPEFVEICKKRVDGVPLDKATIDKLMRIIDTDITFYRELYVRVTKDKEMATEEEWQEWFG